MTKRIAAGICSGARCSSVNRRSGRRSLQEREVGRLREDAGADGGCRHFSAVRPDVLDVGEDEPVLESVEKCGGDALVGG